MAKSQKNQRVSFTVSAIILTYIIVKIIFKLSGFHYDFDEGFFNIKLLIDLAVWVLVYSIIEFSLRKLFR